MNTNINNMRMDKPAGIVLAGGRSSRMGTSKALLKYRGASLVEHMRRLLRQAGCNTVYISGSVPGYDHIPDVVPHEGPARAMGSLLQNFSGVHDRLLFVPVDMPLIPVKALETLLHYKESAFFAGYFLPACLATGVAGDGGGSVKELLVRCRAAAVTLPPVFDRGMGNFNTKEEWEELIHESAHG